MPDWRQEILSFLKNLNVDPAKEEEIVEELSQHLNDRYQDLITRGIPADQAHQTVMHEFNGGKLASELRSSIKLNRRRTIQEEPERRENRIAEFWQNLRYGARVLRFNPGFAAIMILSLALGIGANTAIFQLLNAVRLRTLPVEKPQELANIRITKAPNGRTGRFTGNSPQLTNAIWELVRDQQQGFSKIAAWYSQRLNLNQGGEARYAQTLFVSGNFFDTLGIRPILGRSISTADDQRSCGSRAAMIHESFWQREYGGNRSVLGKKITLAGQPFEITGVTPGSFFGMEVGRNFDVVLPLCAEQFANAEQSFLKSADTWWLAAVGRQKPDWKLDRASAQLEAISRGIFEATTPTTYTAADKKSYVEMKFGAEPAGNGLSNVRREYENPLWILLAISGFVLLIACANLANLMIARASARQKEMAVRLALGASRARLIRQMLSESLMLAVAGGLLGAALAQVLSRALISFLSTERSVLFLDLQPDWRILLFTAGLAIFTCVFFGLMPAIQASRTPPGEAMKANSRGNTSGRSRFESRRLLVVSQVALSLMLVVGAMLFVRTFHNLTTLDAGFQQERLLVTNIDFTPLNIPPEQRNVYKKQIRVKIRSLGFVQSAAGVAIVPLSGSAWNEFILIEDKTIRKDVANFNQVSDGFFQTVGTRLIAGRDFNQTDTAESPAVAIVTQMFVNKFLNGQNPLGRSFRVAQAEGQPDKIFEIVGLVNDTKYQDLREEFTPIVFVPESQDKNPDQEALMIIRSNETLADVTNSIKGAMRQMNPAIGLEFRLFRTMIKQRLLRERLMATLAGFFGLLAAILAMIGLYGVISYMVVRRKNEIGIRIALGANGQNILSMIMREATTLLIAGLAVGTFMALLTASAAKALIFGMQPNDPMTLVLAVVVLAIIAILASFLPAKRASTLNPIQALREE
jgi:putative ABC transport system permease protein